MATSSQELLSVTKQIVNDIDGYQKKNAGKIEKTRRCFSSDLNGESSKNVAVLCKEMIEARG